MQKASTESTEAKRLAEYTACVDAAVRAKSYNDLEAIVTFLAQESLPVQETTPILCKVANSLNQLTNQEALNLSKFATDRFASRAQAFYASVSQIDPKQSLLSSTVMRVGLQVQESTRLDQRCSKRNVRGSSRLVRHPIRWK
jgi:hypothetical protein